MAETKKAKPKKSKAKKSSGSASKARPGATSKTKSKSKSKARASRGSNGASASAKKARKAPTAAANGNGAGDSVKDSVVNGAHGAVNGIASGAQKAKLPLLATGAAIVGGAAAVIAAKSGNHKRKVLGVSVPKRSKVQLPEVHLPKVHAPKGKSVKGNVRKAAGAVSDAARQADEIGQRISRVASSVQTVSETADDAAKKS